MDEFDGLIAQKRLGEGNFSAIPNGMPGVEPRLEVMYEGGVAQGRISLNRWVELCSSAPAKMFGLYPQKGTIAVGSDADIVLFDPNARHSISVENQHMRVDYSAYEGWGVSGSVDTVISRGRVIVSGGEYHGEAGHGQYLKRGLNQYVS
jgi:dihydropyrimidinase